jgi:hypothetical protein
MMFVILIGCIPLDPNLTHNIEVGKNFTDLMSNSPTVEALNSIVSVVLKKINTEK